MGDQDLPPADLGGNAASDDDGGQRSQSEERDSDLYCDDPVDDEMPVYRIGPRMTPGDLEENEPSGGGPVFSIHRIKREKRTDKTRRTIALTALALLAMALIGLYSLVLIGTPTEHVTIFNGAFVVISTIVTSIVAFFFASNGRR